MHIFPWSLIASCQVGWTYTSIIDCPDAWWGSDSEGKWFAHPPPWPKQATGSIGIPWLFAQGTVGMSENHDGTGRPRHEASQRAGWNPVPPMTVGYARARAQVRQGGAHFRCHRHDAPSLSCLLWVPAVGCAAQFFLSKQQPLVPLQREWYSGKTLGCGIRPTWVQILFWFLSYMTLDNFLCSASCLL